MTTRSKLDAAMNATGTDRYAEIESAGISAVMERLGDGAPAMLKMQAALVTGLVRTQQREAKRLAAADEDDLEAFAAEARAEKFEWLRDGLAGIGLGILKMADGQSRSGLFHGFVLTSEGEPAVDHSVKVEALGSKALKAKTDETGYFRIAFADPAEAKRGSAAADREKSAAFGLDSEATDDGEGHAEAERIRVTISDPSGRAVFSDPIPPKADESQTIFRYYPLPAGGAKFRAARKAKARHPDAAAR